MVSGVIGNIFMIEQYLDMEKTHTSLTLENRKSKSSFIIFKFLILPFIAALFINAVIIFNAPKEFVYSTWGKEMDWIIVLVCYSYSIYKPLRKYYRLTQINQ